MNYFDGQAAEMPLDDASLFGAEAELDTEAALEAPDAAQEQALTPPQAAAEDEPERPADAQTSPEAEAAAAPAEGDTAQPEDAPEDGNPYAERLAFMEQQYREAQARMSRACQEAAQMKRQNQELQQQLAQRTGARQMSPADKDAFLQELLDDPQAALARVAESQTQNLVEQRVKQILQPILEATEQQARAANWDNALAEGMKIWPELAERQAQETLVLKMVELASAMGDPELWQKQPAHFARLGAIELFGLPKETNQQALLAAQEAGRKSALQEISGKQQAKAGLSAALAADRNQPAPLSAEESIVQEIAAAFGGKLF